MGNELKTPSIEMLKLLKEHLKDSPKLGVTVLLTKHKQNIERIINTLNITDKNVENLKAARLLASDTGKTRANEKTAPQKICPVCE